MKKNEGKVGRPFTTEHKRLKPVATRVLPRHVAVIKRLGGGNLCYGLRRCVERTIKDFEASAESVETFFRED